MVMRVGAGAPSGASIGHVLSDRLAELRAATKNIGAHAKAGLDLANTDHQCRALLAVMGYGHEVSTHVTSGSDLRDRISRELDRDHGINRAILSYYPARNDREIQERSEAKRAINEFTHEMIDLHRKESIDAGIERIAAIERKIKAIEAELKGMHTIDKNLTKSLESISLKPLNTDTHMIHRIQVKGKFDNDVAFMQKMRGQIDIMESRKEVVKRDKEELYIQQDTYPHSTSIRTNIENKDREMIRIERDIKRIQEDVIKYYQSGIHTTSTHAPSESVSLSIPNNPSLDKGVTLIKSTVAYVKTHCKDYPDIIPYIERIADDCDESTGIHYEPPSIHDGYDKVHQLMREKYALQSTMLYNKYCEVFSRNMGIITNTQTRFEVGKTPIDEKDHRVAYPNDGVYLFFALVCQHKPASSEVTGKLTEMVYKAYEYFDGKNDYARIATALKLKIVECNNAMVKLNWAFCGKKILDSIHNEALYSDLYSKFLRGGDNPEDCSATLDALLVEISRRAKGAKAVVKRDKSRIHAHMAYDDDTYNTHEDEHVEAMIATDDAVSEIMEAGYSDDEEQCDAMWSRFEGKGYDRRNRFDRNRDYNQDRSRTHSPHRRSRRPHASPSSIRRSAPYREHPSAGRQASRRFGGGHSAFTADDAKPPALGTCHANKCGAPCKEGKTLCLKCLGQGKRTGKLIMWNGKEQKFNRPDKPMRAHDAHDMHDDDIDESDMKYDDIDDHDMHEDNHEETLEACVARSIRQYNAKRNRNVFHQGQGTPKRQKAMDAELSELLQRVQQGSGQGLYKEHD